MPHLGLICPELSGHPNPMTTLERELKRRGYWVTLIARPRTQSAGLEFLAIGERDFPVGSIARSTAQLSQAGGLNAIRLTAELLRRPGRNDRVSLAEAGRSPSDLRVDGNAAEPAEADFRDHCGRLCRTRCAAPFVARKPRPGALSEILPDHRSSYRLHRSSNSCAAPR